MFEIEFFSPHRQILCKYIRELYNNSNFSPNSNLYDEHDSIRIKPDINETESSWVIKQSKHLDINKDGKISFEEFYYRFKTLSASSSIEPS